MTSSKKIKIGLLGFGTIGTGVVKILNTNSPLISRRLGAKITLAKVADIRPGPRAGAPLKPGVFTTDALSVVENPVIPIIVELIGGDTIALKLVKRALELGKHVVTANKAMLAKHGEDLFAIAQKTGANLAFEASVGGAIPIIKSMKESFVATEISSLYGIINGTSNYILTKMSLKGEDFKAALARAQKEGYAEADPTFDIDGTDAGHKLAILVMLAFGTPVNFADIYREGITNLTPLDIEVASEFGYRIKLLAIAKNVKGAIEARVHPTLISKEHALANVEGVHNAIFVKGEPVGESMLFGFGAGMMPTAGAVIGDIVDLARDILARASPHRVPICAWHPPHRHKLAIRNISERVGEYYIRCTVMDRPGVLAKIASVLGRHNISIAQVWQRSRDFQNTVPIFLLTHEAQEKNLVKAVAQIDKLSVVKGKTFYLRIED